MNTVHELPADLRTPLLREVNSGLLVHWINTDILMRADLDIRKSIISTT